MEREILSPTTEDEITLLTVLAIFLKQLIKRIYFNNNNNLTIIFRMLYVCVFVWMLMKGSVSFNPNDAKFTQRIDEYTGHVNSYI